MSEEESRMLAPLSSKVTSDVYDARHARGVAGRPQTRIPASQGNATQFNGVLDLTLLSVYGYVEVRAQQNGETIGQCRPSGLLPANLVSKGPFDGVLLVLSPFTLGRI
jgi:hypothetical protein